MRSLRTLGKQSSCCLESFPFHPSLSTETETLGLLSQKQLIGLCEFV